MRIPTLPARIVIPVAILLGGAAAAYPAGQPDPGYRTGSLPDDRPQAVYSAEPLDSWNRIFHFLFTRTVRFRPSAEFAGAAPLQRIQVLGFPDLPVSASTSERIEGGDRAIEPLDPYPAHIGSDGSPQRVLTEPGFSRLKQALVDALREESGRPPLARALMQSDLWAAHDVLVATRPSDEDRRGRREDLLGLLARSVKKLSLSRREIEALPDNYAVAHLPDDLFAADGGWIEVEYLPDRIHESSSDYRRTTRVFLKPSSPPGDRDGWLAGLREGGGPGVAKLDAVALVVQLLLVDTAGEVVTTRLTYEVQIRRFHEGADRRLLKTELAVAELSRKALLLDRRAGGLRRIDERDPAYLPRGGTDYFFASAPVGQSGGDEVVLAPLRKRCQSCHGKDVGTVLTFSAHEPAPPPVRRLNPGDNEHARYVSRRKVQREDFEELKRRWDR